MKAVRAAAARAQETAAQVGEYTASAASGVSSTVGAARKAVGTGECSRCEGKMIGLRLDECQVCGVMVCKNCGTRVSVPPAVALYKETVVARCCTKPCSSMCEVENVRLFRDALWASHIANVEAYVEGVEGPFYDRPGAATAASDAAATAKRLAPLALRALKLTGYSSVVYTYQLAETGVVAALLTPTFRVLVESLAPMLQKHVRSAGLVCSSTKPGAMEAELALRLYYLGCTEAIASLTSNKQQDADDTSPAPYDAVAELGEWLGPPQWLYAAHELRDPHSTPEWAAWYVSRLCATSGDWTLLACVGASRSEDSKLAVPYANPAHFPAFCLCARRADKTALLVLRGSVSSEDWRINGQTEVVPMGEDGVIKGWEVHGGMLRAARAILDDCGIGACIDRLRKAGYSLRVIGHSLGAGVATIITALLNNKEQGQRVRCVAYAPPACVSPVAAESLKRDVIAAVHNADIIPRLSEANCAQLARELIGDDANYRRRFDRDYAAYKTHLFSLGKVQAMAHDNKQQIAALALNTDEAPAPAEEAVLAIEEQPPEEEVVAMTRLAVPGEIAYLHGIDGAFQAQVADHALPTLGRIVVSSRAVDDHAMHRYALALRGVRKRRGKAPPEEALPTRYGSTLLAGDNTWASCGVCGSDVTWTSAFPGSDAARAAATHHCRACGKVVCTFCAPAADKVAGDGIGEFLTLPDLRTALPTKGCLRPARVCRPCFFTQFDL